MTNSQTKPFDYLNRALIGFDYLLDSFDPKIAGSASNYPPYNIVRHNNTDQYQIQLAVTGFDKSEIEVVVRNHQLHVSGKKDGANPDEHIEYIHRGLAARSFDISFMLAEHIEISNAAIENGLLRIDLVKNIPEEEKPKLIEIK